MNSINDFIKSGKNLTGDLQQMMLKIKDQLPEEERVKFEKELEKANKGFSKANEALNKIKDKL